jgi:hypothetical protein
VADPYVPVFLALLLVYAVYSAWARLDPRLPLAAALVLLVATGAIDAAGDPAAANVLAELVLALLAVGIVLVLVDRMRGPAASSAAPARDSESADLPKEGERSSDQTLDRPQEEAVALVDAPGDEHDEEEQARDAEADRRQAP